MADQLYCVGNVYHGGSKGIRLYKDGEPFPGDDATDEQIAELRAAGALKTLEELAPTAAVSDALAAKDAEIDQLRKALAEANTPKSSKKSSASSDDSTEVA